MNEALTKVFPGLDLTGLGQLRKEILGVAILVSFSFFFYRFVYLKNVSDLKDLEIRTNTLNSEITRINAEIQAIEGLRKRLGEVTRNLRYLEDRLKSLKQRLPSEKLVSGILTELADNGFEGKIRLLTIKPLPPEDKDELIRLPFNISLEARFIPLGNYLERIENLQRIIIVDNFKIETKEGASPTVTAQLVLSSYILGYGQ